MNFNSNNHHAKKRNKHQSDTLLPLPAVFNVHSRLVGPLKDDSLLPVFNGELDSAHKIVLIYDLTSAQVRLCMSAVYGTNDNQCLQGNGCFGSPLSDDEHGLFTTKPFVVLEAPCEPVERKRLSNDSKTVNESNLNACWKSLKSASDSCEMNVKELVNELYHSDLVEQNCSSRSAAKRETIDKIPLLQLDLIESFFIFQVLGTLNIYKSNTHISNGNQLWHLFKNIFDKNDENNFVTKYAAYLYFRSKGWIVKDGLKFGSDFILYKDGPNYYHSMFCVTVVRVSLEDEIENTLPPRYINGFVRVSKSVQKHPIICFVKFPSVPVLDDPHLISQMTIRCVHIERWDPNSGLNRK